MSKLHDDADARCMWGMCSRALVLIINLVHKFVALQYHMKGTDLYYFNSRNECMSKIKYECMADGQIQHNLNSC